MDVKKFKSLTKKNKSLIFILIIALFLRLIVTLNSSGSTHPDEVFQSIEPAHKVVYGYGISAWEFKEGARSWFLPGAYVMLLQIGDFFGLKNPLYLISLIHLFNLILSLVTVYALFILGKELSEKKTGLIAAFMCAVWWSILFYSHRTLSGPISTNFVILSLALVCKGCNKDKQKLIFLAGVSLGVAFIIRFPSLIFAVPISFFLLKSKRKYLAFFIPGLFLIMIFQGFLDLFTWGTFFHSPIKFFTFNLLENKSAQFGVSPWYYYLKILFTQHFGKLIFLILPLLAIGLFKAKFISMNFVFYLTAFSFIPHKEERFIIPMIPLLLLLTAVGLVEVTKILFKKINGANITIICFLLLLSLFSFQTLNSTELDPSNGLFHASNFVGRQPDLTGVILQSPWYLSGGYFHVHKDVPLNFNDYTDLNDLLSYKKIKAFDSDSQIDVEIFNYVISSSSTDKETLLNKNFVELAKFNKNVVYKKQ